MIREAFTADHRLHGHDPFGRLGKVWRLYPQRPSNHARTVTNPCAEYDRALQFVREFETHRDCADGIAGMDRLGAGFIKYFMGLPVSVLDLVGMRPGEFAGSAIARTVDLAQHVEEWGYRRFWLAEHHSIAGLACSATPVLIGHVAGATQWIRVGSGGVMLPNHAPLVVAEQFGTLEALYPGRIDLGLGRAPGGDFNTMRALRRESRQSGDDFPELLEELRTYLGPEQPGQAVKAIPGQGSGVPITLLGSSDYSAQLAALLGLPFAFAAHFAPELLETAARLYRTRFVPSEVLLQPWLMVAVQVIAAGRDREAQRLFTTPQQRFLRLIRNQPVELLPPVESMDALWTDGERAAVKSRLRAAIVGSEATVEVGLRSLRASTGADEIIAVTDTWDHAARLDSYQRLARVAREMDGEG